jgi:hypothetical protein
LGLAWRREDKQHSQNCEPSGKPSHLITRMAQISRDRSLYHGSFRPARPAQSRQRLMSASSQTQSSGSVPLTTQTRPDRPSQSDGSFPVIVDCSDAARDDRQHSGTLGADEPNSGTSLSNSNAQRLLRRLRGVGKVRSGTHSGLKSDIAEGPKSANCSHRSGLQSLTPTFRSKSLV